MAFIWCVHNSEFRLYGASIKVNFHQFFTHEWRLFGAYIIVNIYTSNHIYAALEYKLSKSVNDTTI